MKIDERSVPIFLIVTTPNIVFVGWLLVLYRLIFVLFCFITSFLGYNVITKVAYVYAAPYFIIMFYVLWCRQQAIKDETYTWDLTDERLKYWLILLLELSGTWPFHYQINCLFFRVNLSRWHNFIKFVCLFFHVRINTY